MGIPPVLFVHGFGTSHESTWVNNGWTALLEDAGREVIGVDMLGHGSAEKPTVAEDYDKLEDQVFSHFPSNQVDAIGFSMGAGVLLHLASNNPERFNRLVVSGVGRNLFERNLDFRAAVADAVESGEADNPELRYFAQLPEAPDSNREALAAFMRRPNPPAFTTDSISKVTVSTLVVVGENDFVFPPSELMAALPNAKLVTLPGVDHFATPKNFGFIDAALDFLDAQPF
ncbi:MAG: alpha/beta fold hydrolase [Actinomycetota bacterium]|nr:alpha/beta fold hydrolase [Actinomycetota bacterium]MED5276799.1 alpha/beta fold hydrolase [Actinomycetota bacterium]